MDSARCRGIFRKYGLSIDVERIADGIVGSLDRFKVLEVDSNGR
ncbi:MAG TPA: hypothetical protein VEO96_05615 [Thermoplasmata archaeon]|nr:hypothetical protein [Thermoplasmata archaeon]